MNDSRSFQMDGGIFRGYYRGRTLLQLKESARIFTRTEGGKWQYWFRQLLKYRYCG